MNKVFNYVTLFFILLCVNQDMFAEEPTYKFVDLGLQESDQSEAVAVNDNGQVAGMYWMLGEKYYFMWTEQDGITLIDLPETAVIAVLNNAGQIAGNYKDAIGCDRGFMWDQCCGFIDIGTLGGNFTRVYDMNDLGQIVGESQWELNSLVDGTKEIHAFIWENGNMSDLGTLDGELGISGDRSKATGINNQSQIIGVSNFTIVHKRKFLRSKDKPVFWVNGIIDEILPQMDPEFNAHSNSINNIGMATYDCGDYGNIIFDLVSREIFIIPFQNPTKCIEINDRGDFFIRNKITNVSVFDVSYKYNGRTDISDANSYDYIYFASSFENPKSFKRHSFQAFDYNNAGWVVGTAENIYGEHHGVLLVPIEDAVPIDEIDDEDKIDYNDPELPKPMLGPLIADYTGGKKRLMELVKYALKAGADVNDDSRNRHRPLQLSIRKGYTEVALLLMNNGADINFIDRSGCSPISLAIECGQFEVAEELINKGVPFPPCPLTYPDYINWYKFRYRC